MKKTHAIIYPLALVSLLFCFCLSAISHAEGIDATSEKVPMKNKENERTIYRTDSELFFYGLKLRQQHDKKSMVLSSYSMTFNGKKIELKEFAEGYFGFDDDAGVYLDFPNKGDITLLTKYSSGGAGGFVSFFITKSNNDIYINAIDPGRAAVRVVSVNDKKYAICGTNCISYICKASTPNDMGDAVPFRVLSFSNGRFHPGKIGEHVDVYGYFVKDEQIEMQKNDQTIKRIKYIKDKYEREDQLLKYIQSPLIRLSFYMIMAGMKPEDVVKSFQKINGMANIVQDTLKEAKNTSLEGTEGFHAHLTVLP